MTTATAAASASTVSASSSSSGAFFPAATLKHIARQMHQFMRVHGPPLGLMEAEAEEDSGTQHQERCMWLVEGPSSPAGLRDVHAAIVGPAGSPYAGRVFHVRLSFPPDYPQSAPRGTFLTRIFHPNVAPHTGDICVDTLKRDWHPDTTLEGVLLVLRCLLATPNPDSALNADAAHLLQEDRHEFASRARMMAELYAQEYTSHRKQKEQQQDEKKMAVNGSRGAASTAAHTQCSKKAPPSSVVKRKAAPGTARSRGITKRTGIKTSAKSSLKRL